MKKILALILALSLAAVALPMSISAAEAEPIFRVGANRGDWEIYENSYTAVSKPGDPNFALYVLGNASDGEVTLSADLTVGNDYGFMFGIVDLNNNEMIAQNDDQYYLVQLNTNTAEGPVGAIGIERNDHSWSHFAVQTEEAVAQAGTKITVTATYTKDADGVSIVVLVDGKEVLTYTDSDPFTGTGYGLASKAVGAKGKTASETQEQTMRNVVAPDKIGSTMSQEMIRKVISEKEKIPYKAGTASSTNLKPFANNNVSDMFDDAENTRFAADLSADSATITWQTEEAEVAEYLVIYTANKSEEFNRSALWSRLYGSTDGEHYTQIAYTGRLMLKQNDAVFGMHLSNDTAYKYYKFEFSGDGDPKAFESYGINLYTDANNTTATPELYGYVQTKAGTTAGTQDLRVLVEASKDYLAKYDKATLTVTLENGETVVATLTREATVAYTSVTANGETVDARPGYGFIGVVITNVTKDVTVVKASVTFDSGSAIALGSANIA